MAEWATDLLARKLGKQQAPAAPPSMALPACGIRRRSQPRFGPAEGRAQYRHGERVIAFFRDNPKAINAFICESEMVTVGRLNTPCASSTWTTWWTFAPPHAPGQGSRQGELWGA